VAALGVLLVAVAVLQWWPGNGDSTASFFLIGWVVFPILGPTRTLLSLY